MLLSAGLPLPKQIAVHGFLTLEGAKISKSTGNIVHPVQLVDEFGVDAIRYYLLRNLSFASDRDFTREGLIPRYNDELYKDLGNLLNRVVAMVSRYRGAIIPEPGAIGEREENLQKVANEARERAEHDLDAWELGNALQSIWNVVRRTNQYLEQSKPWILARLPEKEKELNTVLFSAAEALRVVSIYLAPFIPDASDRIRSQLGLEPVTSSAWLRETTWGSVPLEKVVPGSLLFPRIET
jgi:methionyl-tRNA synthetase